MDPQSTLYSLLDNIARNDRQAVDECLTALRNWNRCGGFLPVVDRPDSQSVAHFAVRREVTDQGPQDRELRPCAQQQSWEKTQARRTWHWAMEYGATLAPGLHCLLPAGFMNDDWTGKPTCEVCIQCWFKPSIAEDAQGQPVLPTEAIVSLVDDPCRETKVSCVALQRGRAAWEATNSVMGSAMGSLDEES